MATKTPGIQPRSQFHSYWGSYANGTTALPNQSANPLSSPGEFDKLEAGDIAYSSGTPGLFVCTSPGGAAATPAATWVQLAGGGGSTIRDAHQIVVGQTGGSYTDVVGVDADYVDPGDGTQLQIALTAAAALITLTRTRVDVRLRPCRMTLTDTFLSMDTGINLLGVAGGSTLRGVGTLLRLVGGGVNTIEQVNFTVTADGQGSSQEFGALDATLTVGSVEVRRCNFDLTFTVASPSPVITRGGIALSTLDGVLVVEDNTFTLNNVVDAAGNINQHGFALIVSADSGQANGIRSFRNNRIFGGGMIYVTGNNSLASAVGWDVSNNLHANAGVSGGATSSYIISFEFDAAAPIAGEGPWRGPKIVGNEITAAERATQYSEGACLGYVRVGDVDGGTNDRDIYDTVIANNIFRNPSPLDGVISTAINMVMAGDGTGMLRRVAITGNALHGTDVGIQLGAAAPFTGETSAADVTIVGNTIENLDNAGQPILASVVAAGNVVDVVVSGNSIRTADGVTSGDVGNTNWIVTSNRFSGTTVTAATDPSGTWEIAHNIVG